MLANKVLERKNLMRDDENQYKKPKGNTMSITQPSNGAKGRMQNVTIEPVVNGWIVRVGCAPFVALDKELMLQELGRYIDHPRQVMAENLRRQVNEGAYTPDDSTRAALVDPVEPDCRPIPTEPSLP